MHIIRLGFIRLGFIQLGLATLLLGALADSAQAQSFGRFNLPSTFAQYIGCGNGAGHHAPIARAPGAKPLYVRRVAILPQAARVPDHCKYPPQNCFCSGCAEYSCLGGSCSGCGHSAPQMGAGIYQPTMAPAVQPAFAAPRVEAAKPRAKSVMKSAEQMPAGKSQEGSSLRSPPMPSADPVSQ